MSRMFASSAAASGYDSSDQVSRSLDALQSSSSSSSSSSSGVYDNDDDDDNDLGGGVQEIEDIGDIESILLAQINNEREVERKYDDEEENQDSIYPRTSSSEVPQYFVSGHSKKRKKPSSPSSSKSKSKAKPQQQQHRHFSADDLDNDRIPADRMNGDASSSNNNGSTDGVPNALIKCPPRLYDWSKIQEEQPDEGFCFDCDRNQSQIEAELNPHVQRYRDHFEDNYHQTEPIALSRQTQELYNKGVRKHDKINPKFYGQKTICTHFEEHAPTAKIMVESTLKVVNQAMNVLKDNAIFAKDSEGKLNVDPPSLRLYLQVMKERRVLIHEAEAYRSSKKQKTTNNTNNTGNEG